MPLFITGEDLIREDLCLEAIRLLLLLVGVTVTWLLVRPAPGEVEGVDPAPEPPMIVVAPLFTGAGSRAAEAPTALVPADLLNAIQEVVGSIPIGSTI